MPVRLPAPIRALRVRPARVLLVLRAAGALMAARAFLNWQPRRTLVRLAPYRGESGPPEKTRELARAVLRASGLLPFRPTCLERAVALRRLLRSAHIQSTLVVGVRRAGGSLDAHAWVDCAGSDPLGAALPDVYTPILNR